MPLDQFGRAIDGFRSPEHFGLLDGHGEALPVQRLDLRQKIHALGARVDEEPARSQIGRASCRERVCQYVYISVVAVSLNTNKVHDYIDYDDITTITNNNK